MKVGEIIVLHELAHAVLPGCHHHDRRWARTFIELIGCALGFTCKKILMEEYRRRKIPFSPVRGSVNGGSHTDDDGSLVSVEQQQGKPAEAPLTGLREIQQNYNAFETDL
jgi:hypothetical protein